MGKKFIKAREDSLLKHVLLTWQELLRNHKLKRKEEELARAALMRQNSMARKKDSQIDDWKATNRKTAFAIADKLIKEREASLLETTLVSWQTWLRHHMWMRKEEAMAQAAQSSLSQVQAEANSQ